MKITCSKINNDRLRVQAADGFDADRHRRAQANRKQKKQQKLEALLYHLEDEHDVNQQIQYIFDAYVPSSGKAENLGGEYARAMMKIMYRWWNDGDKFYEGYGIDTCGSAAQLLYNDIPGVDDVMYTTAQTMRDDDGWYEDKLTEIASLVVEYVMENPEVFSTPSVDMYSLRPTDIKEMEPEYEYEVDTSGLEMYVNNGCIDWSDVEYFLDGLRSHYGGSVSSWARDAFTIVELTKDQYDEWDRMYEIELRSYLDELESEFPNYGEDNEDEDEY